MGEYVCNMKMLPFDRNEMKGTVKVECADGMVSVYSHCAYCRHCRGVRKGAALNAPPQVRALADIRKGMPGDDMLMNAAMAFNSMVREGDAGSGESID
jgi:hypothetical protein